MTWEKIDHFTGEPYKKNAKSGAWNVIDYISGDFRITELPNGNRELSKGHEKIGTFRTLKSAKDFAETI